MHSTFAIAIHGGAGTILRQNLTPEKDRSYRKALEESLLAGYTILKKDGSSLDAVEAAVIVMEDFPLFNAGKGSVFTADGIIEMDAAIMNGSDLKAGAVAAVRTIKNPIQAARAVMEKSSHVLLAGEGAEQFAKQCGLELVDASYFFNNERWEQLQKAKGLESNVHIADEPYSSENREKKFGTVGAVALDRYGNLAAATSTGGMTNKKFGRIGDTPLIGAGTYSNNKTCAVSGTGYGEYFMRGVIAYDISALMDYKGMTLQQATQKAMEKLAAMGGSGGVIAIDNKGNISQPFISEGMYRGYIDKNGEMKVAIFKDE
jgi:L-asparaginase / beta-aspartyl-peptidase